MSSRYYGHRGKRGFHKFDKEEYAQGYNHTHQHTHQGGYKKGNHHGTYQYGNYGYSNMYPSQSNSRINKYDKSYNTFEKIQEQMNSTSPADFLQGGLGENKDFEGENMNNMQIMNNMNNDREDNMEDNLENIKEGNGQNGNENSNNTKQETEKKEAKEKMEENIPIKDKLNTNAIPYYPLPSNEGYEIFIKIMKKDKYYKTQYSMPFMLSLRDKFKEKPKEMKEIDLPQKGEVRMRAKIITEEAYRITRNYLNENSDNRNFSISYIRKNELTDSEINTKKIHLREILNKITYENFDTLLNEILKYEYDEKLLEIFKNLIMSKLLTEKNYFSLYMNILIQMCKLYNKKTYSNEPKMNLRSSLLAFIQKEFLNFKSTFIEISPMDMPLLPDENSDGNSQDFLIRNKEDFIRSIKEANIKVIGELYLNGLIKVKIIEECIQELIKRQDDFSLVLLCKLVSNVSKKFYAEEKKSYENIINFLEVTLGIIKNPVLPNKISSNPVVHKELKNETKFEILDILTINEKLKSSEIQTSGNNIYTNLSAIPIPKLNPALRTRRKSSINPKDVEYMRKSRFSSKADELKSAKEDNPDLFNEVLACLGGDVDFYKCFRLTTEEFDIIKNYCQKILNKENLQRTFNDMLEEVQCEKFIAIGHLLEIMFSQNEQNADLLIHSILHFYDSSLIDDEDIKHGIVLGLIDFKKNIVDYPNVQKYLKMFLDNIEAKNIMDNRILTVFKKFCDNISEEKRKYI